MNNIVIIGRLGQDPEIRMTPAGKQVATCSLAVDEGFGDNKKTVWFRCVLWEKQAEIAQKYLSKGKKACIRGRMVSREWDKDGQKHTAWELISEQLELIDSGEAPSQPARRPPTPEAPKYGRDEDVPF